MDESSFRKRTYLELSHGSLSEDLDALEQKDTDTDWLLQEEVEFSSDDDKDHETTADPRRQI